MLVAVFMVASTFGAAFAGSSDPLLNTYEFEDPSTPYRTSVLDNGLVDVDFIISPAIAFDGPATYFSSQEDAEAVAATVEAKLDDPVSLSEPVDITTDVEQFGVGAWVVIVEVTLPTDESVGSLSIQAVNPLAPAPENTSGYTIIRNPAEPLPSVSNVDVWIVNPANRSDIISTDVPLTVTYNDYPNETVYRDFPHALDATFDASLNGAVSSRATNFQYYETPDTAIYLLSITIDRNYYGPTDSENWQYRVYRQYSSSAPDAAQDDLTTYVGIDAIDLLDGDIVYWAYGAFDSPGLFPPTITPKFPVPPVLSD
jgi:predicted transcriptional regulator